MNIEKKVKCVHCNTELQVSNLVVEAKCVCGAIVVTNGLVTEGAHGLDWVDVSPVLLNE